MWCAPLGSKTLGARVPPGGETCEKLITCLPWLALYISYPPRNRTLLDPVDLQGKKNDSGHLMEVR